MSRLKKQPTKTPDTKKSLLQNKSPVRICSTVGLGIGLFVWLNLAIYLHESMIESVRLDKLDKLSLQRAKIAAESVAVYVESITENLQTFTKKPALKTALLQNKLEVLDNIQRGFSLRLDEITGIRVIAKGAAVLDSDSDLPIRFTELEMIRRAEMREQVLPEAAKIEGKWRLNFIAPFPFDPTEEPTGVVLLALKTDKLVQNVVQGKISLGKISLQQKFEGQKPVSIFSAGEGSIDRPVSHAVSNSYWAVRFTPSYAMYENAIAGVLTPYIVALVAFVLIVGGFFFFGRSLGLRVESQRAVKFATEREQTRQKSKKTSENVESLGQLADVLDVDLAEENDELLGLEEEHTSEDNTQQDAKDDILDIAEESGIPDVIFRAYDIRGIAKEQITSNLAKQIGQALGSEAIDAGQNTLVVARDARLTSPELAEYLIRGILSTGCNVCNIGTVPTPLMYFATSTLEETQSGVMVTASHNPAEYNGFKVVINGKSRGGDDIKSIRSRVLKKEFYQGKGNEKKHEIVTSYINAIFSDLALAGDITIVIDAANGVTGNVAPRLFEELGCNVVPLFCELNGTFPNHSPDPSVLSNLRALKEKVKETGADLGVAFDGDGDRLIVVTSSGKVIWPDQLLMLFAKDIISRNPGTDVVFDVKSTKHLVSCITSSGGRPIMWKTGHAPMKDKILETGALLGGEFSGHIFIKDRWFGFDDGMYAAARLIEIVSLQGESLDAIFAEFPTSPSTPEIRVPVDENKKFGIVSRLAANGNFADGRVTKIDGVRVDYSFGWGLVRASNTSPNLTLRFEANTEEGLQKVKSLIVKELNAIDSTLKIDWNS